MKGTGKSQHCCYASCEKEVGIMRIGEVTSETTKTGLVSDKFCR
ncbi:unnamed protein product [Rhodiola kirilowii]